MAALGPFGRGGGRDWWCCSGGSGGSGGSTLNLALAPLPRPLGRGASAKFKGGLRTLVRAAQILGRQRTGWGRLEV